MALEIALAIVGAMIFIVGIVSTIISTWLVVRYYKYNRQENSIGMTGTEIARDILDKNELYHIEVKRTGSLWFGNSYSHYFKKVRLRSFIRHQTSLTSVGMGAQKAALAILDKENDPDMKRRIRLVPIMSIGPFAFIPLMVIGFLIDYFIFNDTGMFVIIFGILGFLFYTYAIVLSVLTLKTERKAQDRAYKILAEEYHMTDDELFGLKELFHLYNVQYINDIILSSLELLYKVLEIAIAIQRNKD